MYLVFVNADVFQVVAQDTSGFDIFTTNIADNNYMGFADATIASGNNVNVNILADDNQSLVAGTIYYLDDSGALALTGYVRAGSTSSASRIIKN